MSSIRKISRGLGKFGGTIIGGGVKLVGKKVDNEWIHEVGVGIKAASTTAMDNAGQFLDGTVKGTYGLITKDDYYKSKGLEDIKDSAGRTVKGIGNTVVYTAKSAGTTVHGLAVGDKEKVISGLKNVGKVAAVSALAIGVIDFVDGADLAEAEEIDTRNESMNGSVHPETGVPFEQKAVLLPNGDVVEGTFPEFESHFEAEISEEYYLKGDPFHFSIANDQLYQAIQQNPELADEMNLSPADVNGLTNGITPEGYTWHHHEEPGKMQLVYEEVHNNTGHTGGRQIWGGGTEFR